MQSAQISNQYFSDDTIVAAATPAGGALSIVRVSGPTCLAIARKLVASHLLDGLSAHPRQVKRITLNSPTGQEIDDCLAVFFSGPKSFTGEDSFEFTLHGSSFILSQVIESFLSVGARAALPGEFSFRSVKNGKLTLSQAEAIADLTQASNSQAIEVALNKIKGTQSRWAIELATELRELAALSALGIDFVEQDIDEVSLRTLKERSAKCLEKLSKLRETYQRGARIQGGLKLALVGPPNAGKSSLFNLLLGEDRSIVSSIPGTTRDIVREQLTLKSENRSVSFRISDTAGLRSTLDLIEKEGIERTELAAKDADIILLTVDGSGKDPSSQVQDLISSLNLPRDRTIVVLTKADLVNDQTDSPARLASLQKITPVQTTLAQDLAAHGLKKSIFTSALTGTGVSELIHCLVQMGGGLIETAPGELVLTRLQHRIAVENAESHLRASLTSPTEDLFAADIRHALVSLGPVIGDTLTEDTLNQIFGSFCIGK
jgi:tRNA modification GTPase